MTKTITSLYLCLCVCVVLLHRACKITLFVFILNQDAVKIKCAGVNVFNHVYMLTSRKITCIHKYRAVQDKRSCLGPPPAAAAQPQTESWQPGSAYRIQPIQERAKRPLWTVNNRASGFVSCLWEHKENKKGM